jgi:hypothetical protein
MAATKTLLTYTVKYGNIHKPSLDMNRLLITPFRPR